MKTHPYPWKAQQAPPVDKSNHVIVCGSRDWEGDKKFIRVMDDYLYWLDPVLICVGSEGHKTERNGQWIWRGADSYANDYAAKNWLLKMVFHAAWDKNGKNAGPKRNREMATHAAQVKGRCICFWDGKSPGTKNMIEEFLKLNPPQRLHVVRVKNVI